MHTAWKMMDEFQRATRAQIAYHVNEFKRVLLSDVNNRRPNGFVVTSFLALPEIIQYLLTLKGIVRLGILLIFIVIPLCVALFRKQ